MTVLILRLLCLQLERDIQSIRERNAEVCDIVLLRVAFWLMRLWTLL
jgi:hypothetical protein